MCFKKLAISFVLMLGFPRKAPISQFDMKLVLVLEFLSDCAHHGAELDVAGDAPEAVLPPCSPMSKKSYATQ